MIIVTKFDKDVRPKLYPPFRDEMIEKVLEGKEITYTADIKKK